MFMCLWIESQNDFVTLHSSVSLLEPNNKRDLNSFTINEDLDRTPHT